MKVVVSHVSMIEVISITEDSPCYILRLFDGDEAGYEDLRRNSRAAQLGTLRLGWTSASFNPLNSVHRRRILSLHRTRILLSQERSAQIVELKKSVHFVSVPVNPFSSRADRPLFFARLCSNRIRSFNMGKLTSTIGIPIKLLNEAQVRLL
jgi:hypothetical protein